jgi:hypothetical protein
VVKNRDGGNFHFKLKQLVKTGRVEEMFDSKDVQSETVANVNLDENIPETESIEVSSSPDVVETQPNPIKTQEPTEETTNLVSESTPTRTISQNLLAKIKSAMKET